jgi:hypothetical protein
MPKARRVHAALVTRDEGASYVTVGGKKRVAPKGSMLLSWDGTTTSDCWALDPEVFEMRYQEANGAVEASKSVAAEVVAPSVAAVAPAVGSSLLSVLTASVQGKRDENEDAHVSVLDWKDHLALFAVFDGHGGADASAYCAKKMATFLADEWNEASPESSFEPAFVALDRKYIGKNNDDGSTALVAVVDTKQHKVRHYSFFVCLEE